MGYTMACLKALACLNGQVYIHLVRWDQKRLTPYEPPAEDRISLYERSTFDSNEALLAWARLLQPRCVFVSGWMDKGYLYVARQLKKEGIPVIAGVDTQWKKTIRQQVASSVLRGYFNRHFSYMMVPGPQQYEYAKRLGFTIDRILPNLYAADVALFNRAYQESKSSKAKVFPHRFLFVGRFHPIKGIMKLVQAFQELSLEANHDWDLLLVGNGPIKAQIPNDAKIRVLDFLPPDRLAEEIRHAGVFILPSIAEPWGVVLHEFAAAGMPLIASHDVGSARRFLIKGYNGFLFSHQEAGYLKAQLKKMVQKTDEELLLMGARSHQLGQQVTPELFAATVLSILN
ncbi:MAG: glycosyltransferase family 4 protein [Lewinellaceae bacterium]|nr:glycosyltransferase family 4 protein [Lewinellaceae bacterium]